jgi:type IV fimbrial biogenesis protein FimT
MRHLRVQRGLTLVELMVGLAIAAVLFVAAIPAFQDYLANSRLREGGNALHAQTLFAQSEAIKRNTVVRLEIDSNQIVVSDRSNPDDPEELRSLPFNDGISAADASIDFGGEGRPVAFASASINLSLTSLSCSAEIRCPGLRVDGGGAVRLCGDHNHGCD